MKRILKILLPILIVAIAASGCSFGAGNNGPKDGEPATLRVMYYNEDAFYQEYGMLYSALYPNVEIEVVSMQNMYNEEVKDFNAETIKFIDKEKPDIVILSAEQLKLAAAEGKLHELDAAIEKEKYDTEGLIPGMLDYLRELGGGKVYALTPSFYSQALFYNKDLFDKYKIPYPTDKMSWNEVIQTARLFPTDGEEKERVYGLKMGYSEDLLEIANILAAADGVSYVNPSQKLMTINSDAWKNAVQTALDAINSKSLFFESMNQQQMNETNSYEDYLLRDPFVSGRLAMALGDQFYIQQIEQASENEKVKDQVIKNWDMVSAPVGAQNPDQSTMMQFHNMLAIYADSPNKDTAWDFLQYVTGDDYARVKSKTNNGNGLPVRTKYIKDEEGRNYAAFYSLKPSSFNAYKDFEKLPQTFWQAFQMTAQQELQKVKEGKAELGAVLETLQLKGQELLDQDEPAAEAESKNPDAAVSEAQSQ